MSIGNLAAGGRAKTPMAALVATLLRDAGERPAILSRGYARRRPEDGIVVVRDAEGMRADLDRAGDEPLMLARALDGVAVLVGSSRYLAGRLAETQLGCTVHVLDDGFQHFDLRRDADLVMVAQADLDRPVTLPSGRLREPLDALRAADAVVWIDRGHETGGSEAPPDRTHADSAFRPGIPTWGARRVQARATTSDPVFGVAGIASPANFFAGLRAAGWSVAGEAPFRDHHGYRTADVAAICGRARAAGASRIVTTEKDLVRLLPFRPWPLPIEAVPMRLALEQEQTFVAWLLAVVKDARS